MENSEFDNFFKNKMKGVSAPNFSDQEWSKLAARMDTDEPKGALFGANRLIMGLGLLLLLSNLFWGWSWYRSQQDTNAALAKMLNKIETSTVSASTNHAVVVNTDTIHRTVVVHHYDTIHHYVQYHPSVGQNAISSSTRRFSAQNNLHTLDNAAASSNLALTTTKSSAEKDNLPQNQNNALSPTQNQIGATEKLPTSTTSVSNTLDIALKSQDISLLPSREIPLLSRDKKPNLEYVAIKMPKVHKKRVDVLALLTPKRVSVGATYGLHYLSDEILHETKGRTYGLVASFGVNKHLDVTIHGVCTQNEFSGKQYNQRLGLPAYIPPTEMYEFRYFEVEGMEYIGYQLGLGLKYGFSPEKKINPLLGVAYTSQWIGMHNLEMEYTHKSTGERYEEYIEVGTQKAANGFLEPQVGFVYNKSQHWKVEVLGYYQQKVLSKTLGVKQNWGLRSSLLYQF